MVLCLLGIDSLTVNLATWSNLMNEYEKRRGLRILLLIGETGKQWRSARPQINWEWLRWTHKALGRCWAEFKLRGLFYYSFNLYPSKIFFTMTSTVPDIVITDVRRAVPIVWTPKMDEKLFASLVKMIRAGKRAEKQIQEGIMDLLCYKD